MSCGKQLVQNIDDAQEFQSLIQAMSIMGIVAEDISAVLRTVSAVLQMGNMQFKQDKHSDQATLPDNTGIHLVNWRFTFQMCAMCVTLFHREKCTKFRHFCENFIFEKKFDCERHFGDI